MDTIARMANYYDGSWHHKRALDYIEEQLGQEKTAIALSIYRGEKEDISSKIPQCGVDLIKKFEGCHLSAYRDPLSGNLPITIGWGSTRKRNGDRFMLGDSISQTVADDLLIFQLENDYLPPLEKIPVWGELNKNQQGALLSFAYNLGAHFYGSRGFETITRNLKNRNWGDMERTFLLYRNPGTRVEEGLRRRRQAEADLFLS